MENIPEEMKDVAEGGDGGGVLKMEKATGKVEYKSFCKFFVVMGTVVLYFIFNVCKLKQFTSALGNRTIRTKTKNIKIFNEETLT